MAQGVKYILIGLVGASMGMLFDDYLTRSMLTSGVAPVAGYHCQKDAPTGRTVMQP